MIVEKKFFKGLSLTCHPTGCKAYVDEMIDYVKASPVNGKKINALIIGGATGYGLASRIALAFGCNANTVSVAQFCNIVNIYNTRKSFIKTCV